MDAEMQNCKVVYDRRKHLRIAHYSRAGVSPARWRWSSNWAGHGPGRRSLGRGAQFRLFNRVWAVIWWA